MRHPILLSAIFAFAILGITSSLSAQEGNGEQLFKQRCQACHSVTAGKPALIAPSLRGVVGRRAGATDFKYSPALKGAGLTWTPDKLDQFLAAPMKMVPGTRMIVAIPDARQRKVLIDWLATQR